MRILIVDDDEVSCFVVHRKLEGLGYRASVARSGVEAVTMVERESFDVVISDWLMPDVDGMALCRRVRELFDAIPGRPYTYFVVLTAYASRENRIEAIRAGADDYLVKPADTHELSIRMLVAERVSALHRRIAEQAAEAARLNRELHAASRRDPLTGVGNRHLLTESLEALAESLQDRPRPVAVMLVDVDHFKSYNDLYLHIKGDVALKAVAGVLDDAARRFSGSSLRGVFRFGGEEFAALFDDVDIRTAVAIAESFRVEVEALAIEHLGNDPFGVVTVSVGVAHMDLGELPVTILGIRRGLREADRALFTAKDSGRNQVVAVTADDAITG